MVVQMEVRPLRMYLLCDVLPFEIILLENDWETLMCFYLA
jgi:hypothetical protein